MKITPEQFQKAIDAKLPAYFTTSEPRIQVYLGELWVSLGFNYPGSKLKYCWVSVKDDMTEADIDTWSTDAAVQIKLTQQIDELNEKADRLEAAAKARH